MSELLQSSKLPSEQAENLARVTAKIGDAILRFCRSRLGETFRMEELVRFVRAETTIAPDSPSRILRQLRSQGLIGYEVLSRKDSLYRVTLPVPAAGGGAR